MKPYIYRRLFLLILSLLLSLSFSIFSTISDPLFAQAIASNPLPRGCSAKQVRYKVEAGFRGGKIQVIWTLMVDCDERLSNGQTKRHLLNQLQIDVSRDCQTYGNLQIIENRAYFDGQSAYARCSLPAMLTELKRLDLDLYQELESCGCLPGAEIWVTGNVVLSNNVAASDRANPLLFHDDVRFYMPKNEENIIFSHLYIQQEPNLFTNPGLPSPFTDRLQWEAEKDSGQGNDTVFWIGDNVSGFHDVTDFGGWANFLDIADYWKMVDYAQSTNLPVFVQWVKAGKEQTFSQSSARSSFQVTTKPTTLYIGFDPIEQTYFSGSMTDIGFDPPPCKAK